MWENPASAYGCSQFDACAKEAQHKRRLAIRERERYSGKRCSERDDHGRDDHGRDDHEWGDNSVLIKCKEEEE
jgi:hypothetical protein